jgi:hypothetical protein
VLGVAALLGVGAVGRCHKEDSTLVILKQAF